MPELLGPQVSRELDRLGGADSMPAALGEILAAWPDAVGPAIAANAWPARFRRDGTLLVHASSSTWAFELSQLGATVLEQLGELAPPRIAFLVGPLPETHDSGADVSRSTAVPGPAEVAQGAQIAGSIEDEALRGLVSRAAAAALARHGENAEPTGGSDRLTGA